MFHINGILFMGQGEGISGIFFVLSCKFGLFKIECFLQIEIRNKGHEEILRRIKLSR